MESLKNGELFTVKETIAQDIFVNKEYPWEVLKEIHDFIISKGNTLSIAQFDKIGEDIWIAKSAKVSKTAEINGPCIIDEEAEVRHCAFIRGNAIVGKKCVVGNST